MRTTTITAIAGAIGLAFCATAMANTMSKAQFSAATRNIEAHDKLVRASCTPLRADARSVCMAEAAGRKSVAVADLEATDQPSQRTRERAKVARAWADHSVAMQKCEYRAGAAKGACVKNAEAARHAAVAEATAPRKSSTAYRTAKAKYAIARDRAMEQLADARKNDGADRRH